MRNGKKVYSRPVANKIEFDFSENVTASGGWIAGKGDWNSWENENRGGGATGGWGDETRGDEARGGGASGGWGGGASGGW